MTSPANEQDRTQVEELGREAQEAARKSTIEVGVVKCPDASQGFVRLPRRWVVERALAWLSRFRRWGRDLERLSSPLIGFHLVAACVLMLAKWKPALG